VITVVVPSIEVWSTQSGSLPLPANSTAAMT
jgi:hypothetical protein